MSILRVFTAAAGFAFVLGAMAFTQHDDERVRLEEEALTNNSDVLVVSCDEAKAFEGGRDYMGCTP